MKAAVSLLFLFLFVGLCSFAAQAQIDPVYFNDRVYSDEVTAVVSDGFYQEQMDDAAIIQAASPGGVELCTRNTLIGVPCTCGHVMARQGYPGWTYVRSLTWIRPGWHVTNYKGEHGGGDICYKDRLATPEERERFRRTGH
jgi:hypothetical protein